MDKYEKMQPRLYPIAFFLFIFLDSDFIFVAALPCRLAIEEWLNAYASAKTEAEKGLRSLRAV